MATFIHWSFDCFLRRRALLCAFFREYLLRTLLRRISSEIVLGLLPVIRAISRTPFPLLIAFSILLRSLSSMCVYPIRLHIVQVFGFKGEFTQLVPACSLGKN